jgi:glycolate oxidase FAD binding subunit
VNDAVLQSLIEQVQAAAAAGRGLRIRAGGSKDFYGNAARGEVLDPRDWRGIVSYEPSELVVTARCGTPLVELEAELSAAGQMLGFEPPNFGGNATVGGCVAAGLAGPARMAAGLRYGGVRESVLGAMLLDGRGQLLRFGGTVLKNVAGYDVSRLLAGSMGALGVIVAVSLKVLPRPVQELTLQLELDDTAALTQMAGWQARPLPITASSWHAGVLSVRLAGAAAAVSAARAQLGGTALSEAAATAWWSGLRHQTHPFFATALPLWRVSLPANTASLGCTGPQLFEWNGMQRWLCGGDEAGVRAHAAELGGHATLFRRGSGSGNAGAAAIAAPVFQALSAALLAIHHRLRAEFDPAGVFDFGRLVAD